jgi:hypothetical protein
LNDVRSNLVIRLDEEASCFVFFLESKTDASKESSDSAEKKRPFSVEISFDDLHGRGPDGAERLIGESVLGFFDTLTKGRLNLPRHYIDSPGD